MTKAKGELVYETAGAKVYDNGEDNAVVVHFVRKSRDVEVLTGHGHEFDLAMATTFADGSGPCKNCGQPAKVAGALAPDLPSGAVKVPGM